MIHEYATSFILCCPDGPTKIVTTDEAENEEAVDEVSDEVEEKEKDAGEEKLEQVEKDLLEMLKQQKRQKTKNELLNM